MYAVKSKDTHGSPQRDQDTSLGGAQHGDRRSRFVLAGHKGMHEKRLGLDWPKRDETPSGFPDTVGLDLPQGKS